MANLRELKPAIAGRTVWVIDDDPILLRVAEGILSTQGFHVKTFGDARRALDLFTAVPPDIIVLDVMVPSLDGLEFCSAVRSLPGGTEMPILMMTGSEDPESIHRAFEAGATDFSLKPVNWTIETHRLRYMLRAADTTRDLRRMECDMRQARENWEGTFNAITDIITVLDADLRIVRANAFTSDALDRPLSHIVGRHCYELFQDRSQPCDGCPVLRSFATNGAQSGEIPYSRPGGDWLVSGSPVLNREGRMIQAVHVAHNLTHHKRLEERYRQAQTMEAVGTLAGGIAHEFNNLLQVILCWSELLAADATAPETLSGLNAITDASKRGRALSEQLLTFSRHGAQKPDRRPLDLNRLAGDLHKILPRILPHSVKLDLDLAKTPVLVLADFAQLQQVVLNLAANSSQAMAASGGILRVRIASSQLAAGHADLPPGAAPGAYAILEVSDTGHGMDKKTLNRIFDPFFTTRTIGQGTGLGLSIVYGIVKEHGGHIMVESTEGSGSCFRIYLPESASDPSVEMAPEPLVTHTPLSAAHVLVVDDEGAIRQMLQRFLTRKGYGVSLAATGEEALAYYENAERKPGLVILDLGMPGMGGMRCLEALRNIDPQARILVATGYGLEDVRKRAQELGAVGLVPKPYELRELTRRIQETLAPPDPVPCNRGERDANQG